MRERSAVTQMESAAEASAAELAETKLELVKLKRAGDSMGEHTAHWQEKVCVFCCMHVWVKTDWNCVKGILRKHSSSPVYGLRPQPHGTFRQ